MSVLDLRSPLSGWCMPLAEVPDPVFAGGMMGDGVAIDPTERRPERPLRWRVDLGRAVETCGDHARE